MHLQGLHDFSFSPSLRRVASGLSAIERRKIPPERIGLDGNYDHAGLSKRVTELLAEQLGPLTAEVLTISQRGQVVVIFSQLGIPDDWIHPLIHPMVDLILQLEGAAAVEINGICHLSRALRSVKR